MTGFEIRGTVGRVERQIEKERPVLVLLDEPHGLASEQVGAVCPLVFGGWLIVAIHRRNTVAFVGVVVDARVDESIVLVKATLQRQKATVNAQIPLAKGPRIVAGLLKHLREENFARVHSANSFPGDGVVGGLVFVAVVGGLVADHVVDAVSLRIASGQPRSATGRAYRPGHVEVGQADTFPGQTIQVGCDDVVAQHSEIVVSLIIDTITTMLGFSAAKPRDVVRARSTVRLIRMGVSVIGVSRGCNSIPCQIVGSSVRRNCLDHLLGRNRHHSQVTRHRKELHTLLCSAQGVLWCHGMDACWGSHLLSDCDDALDHFFVSFRSGHRSIRLAHLEA